MVDVCCCGDVLFLVVDEVVVFCVEDGYCYY